MKKWLLILLILQYCTSALGDCAIIIKNDTHDTFADRSVDRAEIPAKSIVLPLAKDNYTKSVGFRLSNTGLFGDPSELLISVLESYERCPRHVESMEIVLRTKLQGIYHYVLSDNDIYGQNVIYVPFSRFVQKG